MDDENLTRLELTASIVSAYVTKNSVPMANLAALVSSVHETLQKLATVAEPEPVVVTPAVPIKKSVTPDYIISLEDGRKFKSLKRHLATHHGMTPEQYRAKWGLPATIRWSLRIMPPRVPSSPRPWVSAARPARASPLLPRNRRSPASAAAAQGLIRTANDVSSPDPN